MMGNKRTQPQTRSSMNPGNNVDENERKAGRMRQEEKRSRPQCARPNLQLHSDAQCKDDDERETSKKMIVWGMNATRTEKEKNSQDEGLGIAELCRKSRSRVVGMQLKFERGKKKAGRTVT